MKENSGSSSAREDHVQQIKAQQQQSLPIKHTGDFSVFCPSRQATAFRVSNTISAMDSLYFTGQL